MLGGLEPAGKPGVQIFELAHQRRRANRLYVTERPAAERREADSEHRTHVAVALGADDSVLEAAHRFVEHREHAPLLDLGGRYHRALRGSAGYGVCLGIDGAFLTLLVVQ